MKVEIGQTYSVKPQSKQKCGSFLSKQGHKIKLTQTNPLYYDILNAQGEKVSSCGCFSESDLVLKKDFNTLDIGDQVELDGDKRTVLSVLPSNPENMVYVLSSIVNQKHPPQEPCYSAQELIDRGYKIVGEPNEEEVKELTVSEVSEKLGYQVKIVK